MASIKISDGITKQARRKRTLIHTINIFSVSLVFIILILQLTEYLGIDPSAPLHQYGKSIVLIALVVLFLVLIGLFAISLFVVRKIFIKINI